MVEWTVDLKVVILVVMMDVLKVLLMDFLKVDEKVVQ